MKHLTIEVFFQNIVLIGTLIARNVTRPTKLNVWHAMTIITSASRPDYALVSFVEYKAFSCGINSLNPSSNFFIGPQIQKCSKRPGVCLSIKMSYCHYGHPLYKHKAVSPPSHLYNGNLYAWKTVFISRRCPDSSFNLKSKSASIRMVV